MLYTAPLMFLLSAAIEIACPGSYGGHLQGIATDAEHNIYWSFTVALVKTDASGTLLKEVEAPTHHGDLTWVDGKVYVAVNLGAFNQEPGKEDSWVYVYDDDSLELLEKHSVPELVHGAGGITWHDGAFVVVGGLPRGHEQNYAYRYDKDFRFLGREDIESGYTNMGIQTACLLNGEYWFGTYDAKDSLIITPAEFSSQRRVDVKASLGIAPWDEGHWLRGVGGKGETRGTYTGAVVVEALPAAALPEGFAALEEARDYDSRKATVLYFVDTACPVANQYAPKISELADEYAEKGVASFRVYAGDYSTLEEIAQHTKDYDFSLPAVKDADYALTREVHATVTPEAVVVDPAGAVQYRGRIDDRYKGLGQYRQVATREDLRLALDAVLAGEPVEVPATKAIGCYIEIPQAPGNEE
ncbi:MAG: redoxin domain-containing protein [Candidatus Hydrogenedens sp.]|nr:redoxin domain-containing protein [Candidatus Hydrogenedens sp.]